MTSYLEHHNDFNTPEAASSYDETSFWSARFGALLFQHLELRRNISILDLGCGTGFPLLELANVHGSSCQVTGVDVWAEALERARTKLRQQGLTNVSIVEADAAALPFPDEQFDLITCNLGLNNFADPPAVVAECYRVLKPGGRVVFTTNILGHMRKVYDAFREALLNIEGSGDVDWLADEEAHRGTTASLSRLLEREGLIITKAIEDQFQLCYLDGTAFFNHWLTKVGFLDGWRGVIKQGHEEAVFADVEARLNERAAQDGELRMAVPMLYLEGQKPEVYP